MKKLLSILTLGIFVTVSGFASSPTVTNAATLGGVLRPTATKAATSKSIINQIGVRGIVTEVNTGKDGANIFVDGVKQSDTLYDKASVHMDVHTIICKDDLKRLFTSSDIKVGDTVEVTFEGPVAMIYPVRVTATKVRIVTKPKTTIPYTVTQAHLAMTAIIQKTVIDWKKATTEDFKAPEQFTIASQNGKLIDIGGKQTVAVTFQVDNSKIMLGPITVYIDKGTKKVLGFGLRR